MPEVLSNTPTLDEVPLCDLCGEYCYSGYELKYYGQADPETGYRDQSIVCSACGDEGAKYDAADMAYDLGRDD